MIRILYRDNDFALNIMVFIISLAALIMSIVLHEIAHGYAALLNGDKTAKIKGRLSLNPLKHLDPIGFFMLVIVGFGYAKPVPVNPNNYRNFKRGSFAVSIAGVTVNIILAFIAGAGYVGLSHLSNRLSTNYQALFISRIFELFFYYLMNFNLIFCFFNLLPLFPLDGFRLIESLTRRGNKLTQFLRKYGMYIFLVLVALSLIVNEFAPRIGFTASWFQYFDILGTYLDFFAGNVMKLFIKFWELIF